MDTMGQDLMERIAACWRLDRNSANLMAVAFRSVARDCNSTNIARTVGIIIAYNTLGYITDQARYRAIDMLDGLERTKLKGDAYRTIRAFFRTPAEKKDIKEKLALMTEIDRRNLERIREAATGAHPRSSDPA